MSESYYSEELDTPTTVAPASIFGNPSSRPEGFAHGGMDSLISGDPNDVGAMMAEYGIDFECDAEI